MNKPLQKMIDDYADSCIQLQDEHGWNYDYGAVFPDWINDRFKEELSKLTVAELTETLLKVLDNRPRMALPVACLVDSIFVYGKLDKDFFVELLKNKYVNMACWGYGEIHELCHDPRSDCPVRQEKQ